MAVGTQSLVFVVLPHGPASDGKLQASIHFTPRLSVAPHLADFPDLLDWPDLIQRHGLSFRLVCGAGKAKVDVPRAELRPDLWREIFKPQTHVADDPMPDFDKRLLVSYPAGVAMDYLRWAYQVAAARGSTGDQRLLDALLEDLSFRNGRESTLDQTLAERRVILWHQQTEILGAAGANPSPAMTPTTGLVQKPAATREMAERFALYHHLPPAPNRPPLPQTPADFAKTLDFHAAIAAIAGYPTLMRALGLVFDVELPAGLCGLSPAAPSGPYGTVSIDGVTPGWKWHLKPSFGFPQTAYVRDADRFDAAPATDSGAVQSGNYLPSDVVGGFLALTPDAFQLINVELDGAMLKALALADNVAAISDRSRIEQVLPSLRSGGLSLIANARALELLRSIADNTAFRQAEESKANYPRAFNARDLVRGYRLDVWSSQDNAWHSLHRRDGTYRFGPDGGLVFSTRDEEGYTQLAVTQPAEDPSRVPDPVATGAGAPQPGTDLYLHERIARWNGWSLSAPRPGRPLHRSADPALATDDDPTANEPMTPFKMVASFKAKAGSLPRLRFGARYRLRARAVDLAGNSPGLQHPVPDIFATPPGAPATYLRFEPVPAPVILLRTRPARGGSLLRMVIRSYNASPALDQTPIAVVDERHIAPPKAGVLTVEHHGLLDDPQGRLKADKAIYDLIVDRDKGAFPAAGDTPIESAAQATIPYFPDPIARGVALAHLPNTLDNTTGEVIAGALTYRPLRDVEPRPGSVAQIGFGDAWPNRRALRLILAEGRAIPAWDDAARTLTVSLSKSAEAEVPVSCFVRPADLELMGVWDWTRAWFEAAESVAMQQFEAGFGVVWAANDRALLTRLVLDGGHEMITPALTMSLVHAVQQPIGRPAWMLLPVVHDPASPIVVAALRNAFSPITAWRSRGSHHAVLLGGLRIHGQSTARIDIQARWTEVLDDLDEPGPTSKPAADHVEVIELKSRSGGMVAADGKNERYVASYIPAVDTLWFGAPFDTLQGVASPTQVAAPVHQFGDTKHRRVRYRAVAASRFSEYFDPGLDFTRTSDALTVSVPSSARPAAPDVLYVVPTLGWERQDSTNVKTEVRQGNGLRVYLGRPWYSSGDGERLGVVLWPESLPQPDDAARTRYKTLFTQWGLDPIWSTGQLEAVPAIFPFPLSVASGQSLTLEGSDLIVDVAGHAVSYDAARRLWFCDVQFVVPDTYGPFVRLALARYQPSSIAGAELSHVVLADFAQLTPDRSASLTVDPADPTRGRVFVGGIAPSGPTRNYISVSVERREPAIASDLGWRVAHPAEARAIEDVPAPDDPNSALWMGAIVYTQAPRPGDYRVVIREYEIHSIDPFVGSIVIGGPTYGERLVYAAIIPWDFKAP